MRQKVAALILLVAACQVLSAVGFAATKITSFSAFPGTITFTASNPSINPIVSGSSFATISFSTTGGTPAGGWSVQVQATSATFASCPSTVPASKVQVICNSAAGGAGASCAGAFSLSTALQTVASGIEGTGNVSYTVTLTFNFTDSWSYIATSSPCTLGLNYLITAN